MLVSAVASRSRKTSSRIEGAEVERPVVAQSRLAVLLLGGGVGSRASRCFCLELKLAVAPHGASAGVEVGSRAYGASACRKNYAKTKRK